MNSHPPSDLRPHSVRVLEATGLNRLQVHVSPRGSRGKFLPLLSPISEPPGSPACAHHPHLPSQRPVFPRCLPLMWTLGVAFRALLSHPEQSPGLDTLRHIYGVSLAK